MRFLQVTITAVLLLVSAAGALAQEPADTLVVVADTVPQPQHRSKTRWIKQLWANGFHINDPDVDYPRFPNFLRKVYNWGDRTFNSYDTTYVVATGKNWKVQDKSFNWLENYVFIFPHGQEVWVRSNIYADIGGYVSFMAVSLGYMFNANELINDRYDARSHFNFNFTCALFNVDYLETTSKGGAKITRMGKPGHDSSTDIPFENVTNHTRSLQATYFFGHRRYSHAAAYCFSKYQLKSAGSWMVGFHYLYQDLGLDFNGLPTEIRDKIPVDDRNFRFHYSDYTVTGGYGYNWALKPRSWLFNITTQLGVGYKHTREDSTDGRRGMVAVNPTVTGSLVYNHRALFVALQGRFNGRFYFNGNYTFFNSLSTAQFTVGARF